MGENKEFDSARGRFLPKMHSGDESSAKLISPVVTVLNGARPPARLEARCFKASGAKEGLENDVSP